MMLFLLTLLQSHLDVTDPFRLTRRLFANSVLGSFSLSTEAYYTRQTSEWIESGAFEDLTVTTA